MNTDCLECGERPMGRHGLCDKCQRERRERVMEAIHSSDGANSEDGDSDNTVQQRTLGSF